MMTSHTLIYKYIDISMDESCVIKRNHKLNDFDIFFRQFQPMAFASNDSSLYQTKTPINFWCMRGLNLRSFIQPSEILHVELTRTTLKH